MDSIKKLLEKNRENTNMLLSRVKNGRVNIMGTPRHVGKFPMFEEKNSGNKIYQREALKSIIVITPIHEKFFSKKNIDNLQKLLRYEVWKQSDKKHVIGRQSDDQLKTVMRSIYLQYGKHQNTNIIEQVKDLNQFVCNYSIPNILSNLELYIGYKKNISNLPELIPLPVNMSNIGLKSINNLI